MIYLRLNYDREYGDDMPNHPIIEIINGSIKVHYMEEIASELHEIFQTEFLQKCELRFMKK